MATRIIFTPKSQIQEESSAATTQAKTSQKGFVEKSSDFLAMTNFAKGIGLSAARTPIIGDILAPEVRALQKKIDSGTATDAELEAYNDIYEKSAPTNKQIIGSALSTAANFIPGVNGAKGVKVAAGAGTGYAMDVGRGLQEEETGKAFVPSFGTYVGAALPILGTIIGKVGSKVSPKALEQESLRLTPTEQQNLIRKGQDIAKFISDKKIVGSPEQRYNKIDTLYEIMEGKIKNTIKNSGVAFSKNEVIENINKIPDTFINDPTAYNQVSNRVKEISKVINSKQGNTIPATIVNEIKRNVYKRAYAKNATDIISDSNKAVGDSLKSMLDDKVSGLSELNKEYGLIIASKKALFNAKTKNQIGMLSTIIGSMIGAQVGSAVAGPIGGAVGMAGGVAAMNTFAGTAARSYSGAAIKTTQNLIKKLPTDKVGNLQITKKALLNLLEQLR